MNWNLVRILLCLGLFGGLVACGEAPPGPPRPLVDNDGDGYPSIRHGGRDCNDNDPKFNPIAIEARANKIDENCNGLIDEITAKTGHWVLTTPQQPTASWHIDLRTDETTGIQYIRCLQFKFQLRSKDGKKIYNLTQWQSRLPPSSIPFVKPTTKTEFKWVYNRANDTIKTTFAGQVLDNNKDNFGETLIGTLDLADVAPEVNSRIKLNFTGRQVKATPSNAAIQKFCERCYGSPTCPASAQ